MTVFTNPAGMTRFQESAYLAGVTPLYLHAPFNPDQDTTESGSDGDTNEFFRRRLIRLYPSGVTDRLRLGVSFQNFFGLGARLG